MTSYIWGGEGVVYLRSWRLKDPVNAGGVNNFKKAWKKRKMNSLPRSAD